jgi:hypothetical protein
MVAQEFLVLLVGVQVPASLLYTAVTQLAECQFSKLDVAGSTPACCTIYRGRNSAVRVESL